MKTLEMNAPGPSVEILTSHVRNLVRNGNTDPKKIRKKIEKLLDLPKKSLKHSKKRIKRILEDVTKTQANQHATQVNQRATQTSLKPQHNARAIFCQACGYLLDEPAFTNTQVECGQCGEKIHASHFESLTVRTIGKRHNTSAHEAVTPTEKARAVIKEPCPRCNHPELSFYTMQLRSADEGQTVFYECGKCFHTFSTNT